MWNVTVIGASKPLYLAVVGALERDIRSGVLRPGDMLPTHRSLARQVGITISTASRIYREAEKRGLVTAVVGRGTFVTVDAGKKVAVIDSAQGEFDMDMGAAWPLFHTDPDIRTVAKKIFRKGAFERLMQYTDPQGIYQHRAIGADWVARFGVTLPPKNITITAGGQHALLVAGMALFNPGDRIAVDSLTYFGLKAVAQRCGLRLESVAMDNSGMVPIALEVLCNRHDIKGIYVSGRFQIPTNAVMPDERRHELKAVIAKHNLILIESDPYGFLSDSTTSTLSALLPEQSVYIAGASKAFYAGLRIAFVAAPAPLSKAIAQGVGDSLITASPLCAELVTESIRTGLADTAVTLKRQEIALRLALFQKIFEGYDITCGEYSAFAWLRLPSHWSGAGFEHAAAKRNVRVFCADRFAVGAVPPPAAVRISLTGPGDATQLKKALHSLRRALAEDRVC